MAGFNTVWQSPLTLPMLAELADPGGWIARVGAGRVGDAQGALDGHDLTPPVTD
jgi:hypothetical protein